MSIQSVPLLSLDFFPSRPVHIEISTAPLSTDAGLLPIRQFDGQIRLTEQFAAALEDKRDPLFTRQPLLDMVRQRIGGRCCSLLRSVGLSAGDHVEQGRSSEDGARLSSSAAANCSVSRICPSNWRIGNSPASVERGAVEISI